MSEKNYNEDLAELHTHLRILSRATAASLTDYDEH